MQEDDREVFFPDVGENQMQHRGSTQLFFSWHGSGSKNRGEKCMIFFLDAALLFPKMIFRCEESQVMSVFLVALLSEHVPECVPRALAHNQVALLKIAF